MTKRIAILIGHHVDSPGVTLASGETEFDYNCELASLLWPAVQERGVASKVFRRPVASYTVGVAAMAAEVIDWFPDLVISLHSNGSKAKRATGSEALYWPTTEAQADRPEVTPSFDRRSEDAAVAIAAAYARAIGIRNRGKVAQSHSWNGPPRWAPDGKQIPGGPVLHVLKAFKVRTAIGESHFMSNPDDHRKALQALSDGSLSIALALALVALVEAA